MLDTLIHRFLMNIAQSLVKSANGIEAYLNKDYVSEKEVVANDLTNVPPAHWIEKVRQGAPHLLDQTIDVEDSELYSFQIKQHIAEDLISPPQLLDKRSSGDESGSFFYKAKEPDIQYIPEASEHQRFRLKKKSVQPQPHIFKKITKAVGLLNRNNGKTHAVSLQPTSTTEKNLLISGLKPNENTTRKVSNPNNKITDETEITIPFISLKTPNRRIQKTVKDKAKNKTTNFQNRNEGRLNKIKPKATETRRVQQQALGVYEHDLLKNKMTVDLYPNPIVQHKAIKFTQRNGINEAEIERRKQDCSTNEKEQQSILSDSLQQAKIISKKKKSVLSDSRKIQETINKPDDKTITQPVKPNNAPYLTFTSKNSKYKTKASSARSVDWSSVVNETTDLINQDRWPQLLKQQQSLLPETGNQHFDLWRVQKQAESKFLSDQEQRGRLWNG